MEAKHTQGIWMVSGGDQIVSMPSQCKISNRISGWNYEEAEANAKLIAAAPEMLEACQRIIELKNLFLPPEPVVGVSEEYKDEFIALNQLLEKAKSVIKKATE